MKKTGNKKNVNVARYAKLYEITESISAEKKIPTIIYMASPELNKQIPSMIKSCNNNTIHIY